MNIVFFDLETSGFDPLTQDIIQIGAIAVNRHFHELERFQVKVDFDVKKANPEALTVNHYSPEDWSRSVQPDIALKSFVRFLNKYKSVQKVSKRTGGRYKVAKLGGHNSEGFDRDFLFKWGKRIQPNLFIPADWWTLDTMQMQSMVNTLNAMKRGQGGMESKSLKLGDLVVIKKAHDALSDVEATIKLAKRLTEILNDCIILGE